VRPSGRRPEADPGHTGEQCGPLGPGMPKAPKLGTQNSNRSKLIRIANTDV